MTDEIGLWRPQKLFSHERIHEPEWVSIGYRFLKANSLNLRKKWVAIRFIAAFTIV